VIRQDEAAENLFMVLSGRVRIVESVPDMPLVDRFLGELGRGEIFGELGILTDERRSATVVAVERTRCLVVPRIDFMEALRGSSDLAIALLQVLARRLYSADHLLARYAPDALTGLIGRRAFLDQYRRLAVGARRHHSAIALLLFDILHLKAINDRFGYDIGDEILRTVSDALAGAARAVDVVARYGGDEFAVLLVDVEQKELNSLVSRVQEKVGELVARRGLPSETKCLVGMVVTDDPPETVEELLWAADQDLRQKKG
jgi:diguanylate cyclase (GGDEF)-like protein